MLKFWSETCSHLYTPAVRPQHPVLMWFFICNLKTKICFISITSQLFSDVLLIFLSMSFLHFWTSNFFSLLHHKSALYIELNKYLHLCTYSFISDSRILNFSSWTFHWFNIKYFTSCCSYFKWSISFYYVLFSIYTLYIISLTSHFPKLSYLL